jgi:hypothetical protein
MCNDADVAKGQVVLLHNGSVFDCIFCKKWLSMQHNYHESNWLSHIVTDHHQAKNAAFENTERWVKRVLKSEFTEKLQLVFTITSYLWSLIFLQTNQAEVSKLIGSI